MMDRFRLSTLLIVLAQVAAAAAPQPGLTLAGVYRRGIDVTRYLSGLLTGVRSGYTGRASLTACLQPSRATRGSG